MYVSRLSGSALLASLTSNEYEDVMVTYETDCCGVEIPEQQIHFNDIGAPRSMHCPNCHELAGIEMIDHY